MLNLSVSELVDQFDFARSKRGLLQCPQLKKWYRMSSKNNIFFAVCILAHWHDTSLQDAGLQEVFLLPISKLWLACVAEKVVCHDLHHYMVNDAVVHAHVNAFSDPHTHTHAHTHTHVGEAHNALHTHHRNVSSSTITSSTARLAPAVQKG